MKTWAGIAVGLVLFIGGLCWLFVRPALITETIEICPTARLAVDVSLNELPEAEVKIEDPAIFCRLEFSSMKKAARLAGSIASLDLVGKTRDGVTFGMSFSKPNPTPYSVASFSSKSDHLLIVYRLDGLQMFVIVALVVFLSFIVGWCVEYVVGEMIKKRTTKET